MAHLIPQKVKILGGCKKICRTVARRGSQKGGTVSHTDIALEKWGRRLLCMRHTGKQTISDQSSLRAETVTEIYCNSI